MAASKPIPVKLSGELVRRLDRVSQATGLRNRSAVIRLCLQSFLDYYEKHGELSLPVHWREILGEMETRPSDCARLPARIAAEQRADYGTKRQRESGS